MSSPIDIGAAKKNADWLAGAEHGRKAERERLGKVLKDALIDLMEAHGRPERCACDQPCATCGTICALSNEVMT